MMELPTQIKTEDLVAINIRPQKCKNEFCLELRKQIFDLDLSKKIIMCAMEGRPLIIMPQFSDRIAAISKLLELGIIYEENGNYYFNF